MANPASYSTWISLLDKYSDGDDSVLEELEKSSFSLDAGTASRFYTRVEQAYKKRKQNWLDKFQRSFDPSNLRKNEAFELTLRNGQQNLSPLNRFVNLPGFSASLGETLKKDLEDFITEIKKSLKDNIAKVSHGGEKLLISVNNFGLHDTPVDTVEKNMVACTPPNGRKIIF